MNGRGKSTVSQSLLLLAQTMLDTNSVENLQLTGRYAILGTYKDVVNSNGDKDCFSIILRCENETTQMVYKEFPDKPQLARIHEMTVNGESFIVEMTEANNNNSNKAEIHNPINIKSTSDIQSLQLLKTTRYVSAGRSGPQNTYHIKGNFEDDRDLDINGENVINILSRKGVAFVEEVRETLSRVLGGAAIRVNKVGEVIELHLNSKDGGNTYRPVNVGFGYSYVLSVIVAAHLAKEGSLLIVENPEAHLHPSAQSRIMNFLIKISKEKNLQLMIETHSDHVVNGMRIAIKKSVIDADDAHILHFSDSENIVSVITCNKEGELSEYPEDFMDEWTSQLLDLV